MSAPMMQIIDIALFIVLAAVVVVLVMGLITLVRSAVTGRSAPEGGLSNRLMRWRVGLQFLAVILVVAGFWMKDALGS